MQYAEQGVSNYGDDVTTSHSGTLSWPLAVTVASGAKSGAATVSALQRTAKIAVVRISRQLMCQLVQNPDSLTYLLRQNFLTLEGLYNMVVNLTVVDNNSKQGRVGSMVRQLLTALEHIAARDEGAAKVLVNSAVGKLVRAALGETACRATDQCCGLEPRPQPLKRAVLAVAKNVAEFALRLRDADVAQQCREAEQLKRWFGVQDTGQLCLMTGKGDVQHFDLVR